MNYSLFILRLSCTGLLLALASGCTHTFTAKITVKPTDLRAGQKMPHRAALVLNQELADYKYEFQAMGITTVYPFGPALQDYARAVATHSFQEVQVAPSAEKAAEMSTADLVLIPRAVKADQSVGIYAWNKVHFTLVVEWAAKERAGQNTVWLKTITAEASEPMGNAFTGGKHWLVLEQKLFDDLSLKTQAAFQESPELRAKQP